MSDDQKLTAHGESDTLRVMEVSLRVGPHMSMGLPRNPLETSSILNGIAGVSGGIRRSPVLITCSDSGREKTNAESIQNN